MAAQQQAARGRMRPRSRFGEFKLLLFLEVVALELLLELLNPAGGVNEGRFAGVERVRSRPDFDVHFWHSGSDGHDDFAAVHDLALWEVFGMDVVLHSALSMADFLPAYTAEGWPSPAG